MKKIIIFSNQLFITEGIKSILNSETDIQVVATGDISNIIQQVEQYQPNTLLIQLDTSDLSSKEMIGTLIDKYPHLKMLVMLDTNNIQLIKDLIRKGVLGLTRQKISTEELVTAVGSVTDGHPYLSNSILELIYPEIRELLNIRGNELFVQLDVRRPYHLLTTKEAEVLQLLTDGHSNRVISEKMGVSEKTTKNHVSSILLKMEVSDRTKAVLKALKNGWVHLN